MSQNRKRLYKEDIIALSEEKCRLRLLKKLQEFKEEQIIKESLNPSSASFEVLEFYGDSVLYQTISQYIMTTRRFMDPHLMTQLRMHCIRNTNLAEVFDLLHLSTLTRIAPATVKPKADVVEAMIGELAEHDEDCPVLNELTAYIAYVGEKAFFAFQAQNPPRIEKQKLYTPSVTSEPIRSIVNANTSNGNHHYNGNGVKNGKGNGHVPEAKAASPANGVKKPRRKSDELSTVTRDTTSSMLIHHKIKKEHNVVKREILDKEAENDANARPESPKPLFYNFKKAEPLVFSVDVPLPQTANPALVVRRYEREPRTQPKPSAKTKQAPVAPSKAEALLAQLRSGEMKILQRPIANASVVQRTTYEYD